MIKFIKLNIKMFILTILIEFFYCTLVTMIPIFSGKVVDFAISSPDVIAKLSLVNIAEISFLVIFSVVLLGLFKSILKTHFLKCVRIDLEKHIVSLLLSVNIKKAKSLNILHKQTDLLMTNYFGRMFDYVKSIIPLCIALSYSFYVSWKAMLLIFFCFICAIVINQLLLIPFSKKMNAYILSNEKMNAYLISFLNAIRSIKHFGGVAFAQNKINIAIDNKYNSEKKLLELHLIIESINNIFSLLLQIVPILILSIMYMHGNITIGSVLSIMLLFEKIIAPIEQITNIQKDVEGTKDIRKALEKMLSLPSDTFSNSFVKLDGKPSIKIENLTFSYKDKIIINDASFTFDFGKKYLLIGDNGAGKSTLIKLLTKQILGYSGRISVGGMDIERLSSNQLYSIVGIIPQMPEFFEDTIQYNICLSSKPDLRLMREVMQIVGLQPDKADIVLNSDELNISGGELQRLALARAYYNKRSIFLFDEVLVGQEKELAHTIEEKILLIPNSLVINISHRSEKKLMYKYDEVIKLEDGKLVPIDKQNIL